VLNEPTVTNTYGEVPVGDNAGAFARGFTTGPDATAVSFNSAAGTATFTFDQRLDISGGFVADPTGFILLDQDGTPIPSATATDVTATPSAAGPVQVTVDFPPAAFSVAKAVMICGTPSPAVAGFAAQPACNGNNSGTVFSSFEDDPNAQQILSPFATSAVLKTGSHAHWKHASRMSRKTVAKQLAAARHRAHARKRHHRHS
jgi:hypothetical protein